MGKRVLLVGESWVSEATHYKGFDSFTSVTFHSGADWYNGALRSKGHTVEQMYAHDVPARFPHDRAELASYDVIVLSDIGTNSFLLPVETWLQGKSTPKVLRWVPSLGGLGLAPKPGNWNWGWAGWLSGTKLYHSAAWRRGCRRLAGVAVHGPRAPAVLTQLGFTKR